MRLRPLLHGALAATLAAGAALPAHAQPDTTLRARRADVPVPGAMLATDIYAPPDAPGPSPTILVRTPYGREGWRPYGEFFARRGYVFVAQDVRGRGASSGRHVPFLTEEDDGAATLDWLAAQPWSDGRVGMMGPSYGSYASMVLVARGHPALKAVVNNSGMIDLDELVFAGGALNLMIGLPWTRLFAGPPVAPDQPWDSLFAALPVGASFTGPAAAMTGNYPEYNQRLYDAGAIGRLQGRTVPVLHLTGWNDFLYRHTLRAFEAMRGGRAEQVLVVGPWAHDQQQRAGRPRLGGEDFGERAAFGPDSIRAHALRWFDRHLRGPSDGAGQRPVRVFVMGANRWEAAEHWPLPGARQRAFHLESDGSARGTGTAPGAGRLRTEVPPRARHDEYAYDPRAPVPTVGGSNFHLFQSNLGPLDQRSVEQRPDVLSYTTEPFAAPAMLAGPISVTLHVSSVAPDADFTAKLVLVRPDGVARIVEDGIVRARFHRSRREPRLLTPGEIVPVTIDLGATALAIPAGARLRLEVSSGNFPKYDRNPQTGENPLTATRLARATHRIHHGPAHPSRMTVWLREGSVGPDAGEAGDAAAVPMRATAGATPTASTPAPRPAQAPIGAGCIGFSWSNFTVSEHGEAIPDGYPVVTRTVPGGPAKAAGLSVGDTIVTVDAKDVLTDPAVMRGFPPGRQLIIGYRRAGEARQARVIAGRVVEDTDHPARADGTGAALPPPTRCAPR